VLAPAIILREKRDRVLAVKLVACGRAAEFLIAREFDLCDRTVDLHLSQKSKIKEKNDGSSMVVQTSSRRISK
jgi:DNA-binding NarL/FixJ family response regulator